MIKLIKKIWNSSPNIWFLKLKQILLSIFEKKDEMFIHKVKNSGKDFLILMPKKIPETYNEMLSGSYENDIINKILNNKKGERLVVWDIGAHIGYHSLLFASNVSSDSKIIAFDPNPNNTKWFKSNIELNGNYSKMISFYEKAISNKIEKIEFNIGNKKDATSSGGYIENITPPLPKSSYIDFHKIFLETDTIDNLIQKQKIEVPNIIKIDTEGAELKVLQGAINSLIKFRPELIIEIHTIPLMYYVSNMLRDLNYTIIILDEKNNEINTKIIYAKYR